jgi:hypothetical protein
MDLVLDLPAELESELTAEANRLGLPLKEYALRILAVGRFPVNDLGSNATLQSATIQPRSTIRLRFRDGATFDSSAASLGIDSNLMRLSSVRLSADGTGLEIQRMGSREWATFDAISLRSRVDPVFAKSVKAELDDLSIPDRAKPREREIPKEWFEERHRDL